jgi:hypothetical protein
MSIENSNGNPEVNTEFHSLAKQEKDFYRYMEELDRGEADNVYTDIETDIARLGEKKVEQNQ